MTLIAADIARVPPLLRSWPAEPWRELVAAIAKTRRPPLLLIGEGSSRLFPAGLACSLARRWGLLGRLDQLGAREADGLELAHWQLVLLSNSGETREVVELAQRQAAHPARLAVVGTPGGTLTRLVADHRAVLAGAGAEGAVAATVSVVGQAFCLVQALAAVCGRSAPAGLADAAAELLAAPLPGEVLETLASTMRLFWCGEETGAGAELALKTTEIPGLLGMHLPGTLVLHGLEEIFSVGDTAVLLDPPDADLPAIGRYVLAGTPAKVITVTSRSAGGPGACWTIPDLGDWTPFLHLIAGWRLLIARAEQLGRDPDRPRRARKVGNPLT
jgi:glucosamine--fructose-6-phosphate aminotransferase (isomerizing)